MGVMLSRLVRMLFAKKEMRLVMIGLNGAGKSTILDKLKLGDIISTTPTNGFIVKTVEYKDVGFTVWDVGRDKESTIRSQWNRYLENTQGLIFVVDSSNRDRISEAKQELHDMLTQDSLRDVPLLVFANKQDLPNAMRISEIINKLNLRSLRPRRRYIQSTCATSGEGLFEGLEWLSSNIPSNNPSNNARSA